MAVVVLHAGGSPIPQLLQVPLVGTPWWPAPEVVLCRGQTLRLQVALCFAILVAGHHACCQLGGGTEPTQLVHLLLSVPSFLGSMACLFLALNNIHLPGGIMVCDPMSLLGTSGWFPVSAIMNGGADIQVHEFVWLGSRGA